MTLRLILTILFSSLAFDALAEENSFPFPTSITCTVTHAVTASVQTGVFIDYPSFGHTREWTYEGNERYSFIFENKKVFFETRILNRGNILELLRDHTTYSIDLANSRYVMIQAMAGDSKIPNPAIGGMDSGPCSISTGSLEIEPNSENASNNGFNTDAGKARAG